MPQVVVVIPCFNEASRLDGTALLSLVGRAGLDIVFVDDGSSDETPLRLRQLCECVPGRADVVAMPRNAGKAEAVRAGMRRALDGGAEVIGYVDADLATPPAEIFRLIDTLVAGGHRGVIGSRVAILGADIQRSGWRHYLGRVFATAAAVALRTRVYDTQCGAKFFRADEGFRAAISTPFRSRWAFDVELLGRLLPVADPTSSRSPGGIVEVPLREWHDVRGSKLRAGSMLKAGLDLVRIAWSVRRSRQTRSDGGP